MIRAYGLAAAPMSDGLRPQGRRMIRPGRLARAALADLLLAFAAWVDRYDTRLADRWNAEDDQ